MNGRREEKSSSSAGVEADGPTDPKESARGGEIRKSHRRGRVVISQLDVDPQIEKGNWGGDIECGGTGGGPANRCGRSGLAKSNVDIS